MLRCSRLLPVALLLLLGAAAPAYAAPEPAPLTFGVQPADGRATDARPAFTFGVTPGASLTDEVALVNYAVRPVTLNVKITDAISAPDGGFTLKATKEPVTAAGSWVSVPQTKGITVPGRTAKGPGTRILPLSVKVPMTATPGDHSAGILAILTSKAPGADGPGVQLEQRVGVRVHFRVTGVLNPRLDVDQVAVSYRHRFNPLRPGVAVIDYRIRNTGNITLATTPAVTVNGIFVDSSRKGAALPTLLPGAVVLQRVEVPAWPQFWMGADVRVAGQVAQPTTTANPAVAVAGTRFLAVPWTLPLIVALLVTWRVLRRRLRHRTPESPPATRRATAAAGQSMRRVATSSVLAGLAGLGLSSPALADTVPYQDPGATGTITLCDKSLRPVTQGSILDRPFVWRAVGSQQAPAPYNGEGRVATLFAFQPVEGVSPGEWVGEQIVGPARYTTPARPTSQFTEIDYALEIFLDRFPARWDGLLQLRLMYGAQNAGTSTAYAAMDLQVKGTTWRVLRGGTTSCGATADAVSFETALPDFKERIVAARKEEAAKAARRAASPGAKASGAASASPSAGSSASNNASENDTGFGSNSSGGRNQLFVGSVALALVAAAVLAFLARRSRPTA